MIELSTDQHQALVTSGFEPVRAIDPATKVEYVLVRAEVYDRIKPLIPENSNWPDGAYLASMEVFARDGWDEPGMDVYDALDPRKAP